MRKILCTMLIGLFVIQANVWGMTLDVAFDNYNSNRSEENAATLKNLIVKEELLKKLQDLQSKVNIAFTTLPGEEDTKDIKGIKAALSSAIIKLGGEAPKGSGLITTPNELTHAIFKHNESAITDEKNKINIQKILETNQLFLLLKYDTPNILSYFWSILNSPDVDANNKTIQEFADENFAKLMAIGTAESKAFLKKFYKKEETPEIAKLKAELEKLKKSLNLLKGKLNTLTTKLGELRRKLAPK